MRGLLLFPIALLDIAFAIPADAGVTSSKYEFGAGQAMMTAAPKCPPGSWWIPEGYQRKGKWKPGHCSKVVNRPS
jgi:hypothetical protein